MFDPSTITLAQASGFVKDWAILGILISVVWRARGLYSKAERLFDGSLAFINRVDLHMTRMELVADKITNNHLAHMEHDLRLMSGRKSDVIETDESFHSTHATTE